jgi:hypothetical protein
MVLYARAKARPFAVYVLELLFTYSYVQFPYTLDLPTTWQNSNLFCLPHGGIQLAPPTMGGIGFVFRPTRNHHYFANLRADWIIYCQLLGVGCIPQTLGWIVDNSPTLDAFSRISSTTGRILQLDLDAAEEPQGQRTFDNLRFPFASVETLWVNSGSYAQGGSCLAGHARICGMVCAYRFCYPQGNALKIYPTDQGRIWDLYQPTLGRLEICFANHNGRL